MSAELLLVGFLRETHPFLIRGRRQTLPSFGDFVSDFPQEDERNIVAYLQKGKEQSYISSRPIYKKPEDRTALCHTGFVMTDGVWAWPSELPYYVEAFHFRLPSDFVSQMRSNEWQPPPEIDVDKLQFPGAV